MTEIFNFFGRKNEGKELSNFWKGIVVVDGRLYSSGEAAFHGSKYIEVSKINEGNRKEMLLGYGRKFEISGEFGNMFEGKLKQKGGKKGMLLNGIEIELWNRVGIVIQKKICSYKYKNYEVVRDVLDGSRGKVLIHPAMRCSYENIKNRYWEGRGKVIDDKIVVLGKNMLGNIWMDIRDEDIKLKSEII